VPLRRLLARVSLVLAVALATGLAVVGGISLHGEGVVAVVLAGVTAGCLTAIARDRSPGRRTAADAAWRAAVGTVVALLAFAGSLAVAGPAAPVLVVLGLGLVGPAWWARRAAPPVVRPPAAATRPAGPASPHPAARRGPHPSGRGIVPAGGPPSAVLPPAAGMPVEELTREWRRTAAVLEHAVDPAARALVVRRRGEVLDELERRDPAGFARWLAGGASAEEYPVRHLRGDSATGPGPA